jgi:hypothetical protein
MIGGSCARTQSLSFDPHRIPIICRTAPPISTNADFHKWQPGEMVLWDSWRMLHCVTPGPYEDVRIVERTTLGGNYGLGRKIVEVE